jgi:hypothetical protein
MFTGHRSVLVRSLLVAGLLALAGCSTAARVLFEDDNEPPVKNEAGIRAMAQQFGEAIQKEDYAAAYALLTAKRKEQQSLEQFTAEAKQQRQEYFGQYNPTELELTPYMPFADEYAEWSEVSDIPYGQLLGMCDVTWQGPVTTPEGGEAQRFETYVDIVVVDEGGQPKIAYIDWIDNF